MFCCKCADNFLRYDDDDDDDDRGVSWASFGDCGELQNAPVSLLSPSKREGLVSPAVAGLCDAGSTRMRAHVRM